VGVRFFLVVFAGDGSNLVFAELVDHVADRTLFVAELKRHSFRSAATDK
jgi:hypothetical protein